MVDESDIGGRIFGLSIWDLLFGELDIINSRHMWRVLLDMRKSEII